MRRSATSPGSSHGRRSPRHRPRPRRPPRRRSSASRATTSARSSSRSSGSSSVAELRSAIFIDQLQPQTMCYLGTWVRGRLPRTGMAAAVIEVAPGLDIEPLTDVALKSTELQAGILVVERQFGYLEFHSRSTASVRSASEAVLDELGATPADAMAPKVLAAKLVSRLDHQHAFLINRNK